MDKQEILKLVVEHFQKEPIRHLQYVTERIDNIVNREFKVYQKEVFIASAKNQTLDKPEPDMVDISFEIDILKEILWDLIIKRIITPIETKDDIINWKFIITNREELNKL